MHKYMYIYVYTNCVHVQINMLLRMIRILSAHQHRLCNSGSMHMAIAAPSPPHKQLPVLGAHQQVSAVQPHGSQLGRVRDRKADGMQQLHLAHTPHFDTLVLGAREQQSAIQRRGGKHVWGTLG